MKNKRTLLLLFVIAFVASAAFAQMKPSGRRQATPPRAVARREVEIEAPAQERTVSDNLSSTANDTSSTVSATASDDGNDSSTTTDTSSTTPNIPLTAEPRDWRFLTTILVAAVIFLLAAVALVLQMRKVTQTILAALPRGDEGRQDRERVLKEQLAIVKNDTREQIASLRTTVESIPDTVQQRVQKLLAETKPPVSLPSAQRYETREPPRPIEDASAQLLTIANQIVQQTPTTLDAFRSSTRQLSVRISPWPNTTDGAPVAFIVEHRDAYYAIPNVIKPARLPQEWFNRADFGVNDEIQRVVELPRLRRRGNEYEVAVPGVFAR